MNLKSKTLIGLALLSFISVFSVPTINAEQIKHPEKQVGTVATEVNNLQSGVTETVPVITPPVLPQPVVQPTPPLAQIDIQQPQKVASIGGVQTNLPQNPLSSTVSTETIPPVKEIKVAVQAVQEADTTPIDVPVVPPAQFESSSSVPAVSQIAPVHTSYRQPYQSNVPLPASQTKAITKQTQNTAFSPSPQPYQVAHNNFYIADMSVSKRIQYLSLAALFLLVGITLVRTRKQFTLQNMNQFDESYGETVFRKSNSQSYTPAL